MPKASSVSERISRHRERQRRAGFMRVEVLIPKDKVDAVRAYAAQLREGSQSERINQARKLVEKAYQRYHASCLDNIAIKPENADLGDAAVIAAALMHRGNAQAFKLGRQIRDIAR